MNIVIVVVIVVLLLGVLIQFLSLYFSFLPALGQVAPGSNLPPSQEDDPVQMDVAAEHHRVINLNDDMPQMQMPAGGNAQHLPIPNV
jgi:flagellar basal body-associated protein FliL